MPQPIQISSSSTAMDKQNHLQRMALTWPQKLLTYINSPSTFTYNSTALCYSYALDFLFYSSS